MLQYSLHNLGTISFRKHSIHKENLLSTIEHQFILFSYFSKNILLDNNNKGKLSDFGLAVHANKRTNENTGPGSQSYTHFSTREDTSVVQRNKGYCAREVLNGRFSPKSDTYAFGVVSMEKIYVSNVLFMIVSSYMSRSGAITRTHTTRLCFRSSWRCVQVYQLLIQLKR